MSVVSVDTDTGEVLSGDVIQELDAAAARALTDRIVHSTTLAAPLVADAWQGRAWKSLGYKSWEDYADAELPTLGTNQSDRHVLLVGLRKVGMSTRAIGVVTGLHPTTVGRHVSGAANAAPVSKAFFANKLPLKFSPRRAKNKQPSLILRVSVLIT